MCFPTKPCFLVVLVQLLIPGQSLKHLGQPREESCSETLQGKKPMNCVVRKSNDDSSLMDRIMDGIKKDFLFGFQALGARREG